MTTRSLKAAAARAWAAYDRTEGQPPDVQRAARFFYLQQQSFGGKVAGQCLATLGFFTASDCGGAGAIGLYRFSNSFRGVFSCAEAFGDLLGNAGPKGFFEL